MKTKILALLLLFFMGLGASAQEQEMDNLTNCLKNVSLYTDYVKQNNIQEALPFWHKALCCCPDTLRDKYRNSYVNLFVNGIRIMKHQIDNATDEVLKEKYVDSLLWMYDQRMEVLPSQRKTSLWRKAADYARYRPQDVREVYNLCLESIEMLDDKTDISTIVLAMQQASSLYSENNLSADSVMWLYMELSTILDKQSKTKDVTPVKETLDDMFIRSGVANCENLIAVYTPKFKENPKDVEMLEKLVSLLSANQCTQDKLYFDATEALLKEKPSAEAAVQAAQMFRQQGNYSKADEYYKKAIDMETSNEAKSKYYVELGNITNRDLSKPQEARGYAKKALDLDGKNGYAYL
ncbi:MAG: tetratricopeptide repeat protein, partial [Prevotellaceae bacterium]|nr:tetratricopeptide repeat protein [Prevotellaceae bacterium]